MVEFVWGSCISSSIRVGIGTLRCEGLDQRGVLSPLLSSRQYGQECISKLSRPQRKQKRVFSSGQSLWACPGFWQFQHRAIMLGELTRGMVG